MTEENALNIYTDGSAYHSPRRGGVGIRFITYDENLDEVYQDIHFAGYQGVTINQMELTACILALKQAIELNFINSNIQRIIIFTDSMYVAENYKKAIFVWPGTKWHIKSGRPVSNAELWKELVSLIRKTSLFVEIRWVKGHSKDQHNRAVDRMAKESSNLPFNKPISFIQVRRKISRHSVDIGCVIPSNQRISIRIITSEYLKIQKISKYKYEVISKNSPYLGFVDVIYSDENLKAGHSYYVKFNNEKNYPKIVKIYREIQ